MYMPQCPYQAAGGGGLCGSRCFQAKGRTVLGCGRHHIGMIRSAEDHILSRLWSLLPDPHICGQEMCSDLEKRYWRARNQGVARLRAQREYPGDAQGKYRLGTESHSEELPTYHIEQLFPGIEDHFLKKKIGRAHV